MTKEHRTTEGEMGDNFVLRIKEQKTRLTLHEHDDDDECYNSERLCSL